MPIRQVVAAFAMAIVIMMPIFGAEAYERFSVEEWKIVGVWQQSYGIDVQNVIETKGDEYRLRYVSSDEPKATKNGQKLTKTGFRYCIVGSTFGNCLVVEGANLKTYDNEGYIDTLKPFSD